jgi:hypothetical protein
MSAANGHLTAEADATNLIIRTLINEHLPSELAR